MPPIEERLAEAVADRYRVIRRIGTGATGSVFLAEDEKLRRRVAIKVLHPELSASVTGTRFLREIQIAAGLAHPHIVPVHDAGQTDGLLYFVMRFQEGESLRALLDREGTLPVDRAVSIARDVAEGLAYAHGHGVIHRDIKPANILLTDDHAVIADFGVARALEAASAVDLTATAAAVGTPLYMSPEQASASPELDGRSDVYSLGCVLYEMLVGEPPFRARSSAAVFASHIQKPVPPVRERRADVPRDLADLLHRSLAKAPAGRFRDADSFRRALETVQVGRATTDLGFGVLLRRAPSRVRKAVGAAVVIGLAVLAVFALRALSGPSGSGLDPSSFVVLSFRDAVTTPEEEDLLVTVSGELTRQINRWEPVRAVPQIALSGILFDLGFERPTVERSEEGVAVAREFGAGTLVALSADTRGDSVLFSAELFDARTGRNRGKPHEAWSPVEDPTPAAAKIALRILGLEGTASEIAGDERPSAIPGALIEYASGKRALEEWKLFEAEAFFRNALAMDSAFAMAHHFLALTLYWEMEDGPVSGEVVGPQIQEASTLALRYSSGLPSRDSLHILAFNRFQAGDYASARDHYRMLLERDSADVYAWLHQGSVEYEDPWLEEMPNGELRPRGNLNQARRSFVETVQLAPGFEGAYGKVFDIAQKVHDPDGPQGAPGFEMPREEFLAPWEGSDPFQMVAFFLLYLDSLVWVRPEALDTLPQPAISRGSARVLDESVALLRRWAAFEPRKARPQRELADWMLTLRSEIRGPHPPFLVDSLSREALEHAARGLELAGDTSRNELFLVANLKLASGDVEGARSTLELAMAWEGPGGEGAVPSAASNLLLFSGQPARALEMLEAERPRRRYYPHPVTEGLLDDEGAEPVIQRLLILSATGVSGGPLASAYEDLMALWRESEDKTEEEIRFLRRRSAPRLALPLWYRPDALQAWSQELDLQGSFWRALVPELEGRDSLLAKALEEEEGEIRDPIRSFLLGAVAQEVEEHALATRLFSRLDSLAYNVRSRDPGWGLLALSYLHRGRAYEAQGEEEMAIQFYRRFVDAWSDADLPRELGEEARQRLEALSG